MLTIYAHGATLGINGPSFFSRYGDVLDANNLAKKIREDSNWNGKDPVWLKTCRSGENPQGLAQRLSDLLGIPVFAPNTNVWLNEDGVIGPFGKDQNDQLDLSKPGKYIQFYPK